MNKQVARPHKKPNPKIKEEKLKFINQLRVETQAKFQNLQKLWQEQLGRFSAQKKQVDTSYDDMAMKVDSILSKIQSELYQLKKNNAELADKIEQKKMIKNQLQTKKETTHLEVSAEIDIELKLQQRAAELHRQLGECKRRRDATLEQKIQLKKSYVRAINQYKKLKSIDEDRSAKKEAMQKKLYLQKKKMEMEEEERRQREAENDPMNKYKSLLAAAGHIKFNSKAFTPTIEVAPLTKIYKTDAPITKIYQPEGARPQNHYQQQQNMIINSDAGLVFDSPQNDEGIWLENNIRTLLSTGNYTDDDPVIRNLRAELARLRCY
ncbi:hypothetical protein TRFO_14368 [Tritrichomonas foetus]|uniref:Uncharacterized protein n=1 Tax=Tritrichomonas foetus TaxID=1144522 RepID=A0A1J4KVC2_9EUKA|nr:hypothetical protein TRFO_14368 [Tritrichomonas foetus]|eukprot:OHT15183.1 hypothetical protein TRFO_14368 [Tritrichomonas foetus]